MSPNLLRNEHFESKQSSINIDVIQDTEMN